MHFLGMLCRQCQRFRVGSGKTESAAHYDLTNVVHVTAARERMCLNRKDMGGRRQVTECVRLLVRGLPAEAAFEAQADEKGIRSPLKLE